MDTKLVRNFGKCLAAGLFAVVSGFSLGQTSTFAGNPQHTNLYNSVPAQPMETIKWQTVIEESSSGAFAHYGAPLITKMNTVIVPVHHADDTYSLRAIDGTSGATKYTLSTDWKLPAHNWIPVYQACISIGPDGSPRLYYPGAGGTVWFVDNIDSNAPTTPQRVAFFGNANYTATPSAYNTTVFVNTPITSDSKGTIYFGFVSSGGAPSPIGNQSGYARIDKNGAVSSALVGDLTGDSNITQVPNNSAPALSIDEKTLYVPCKWATNRYYGYLLALDASTLSLNNKVFLLDPRTTAKNAGIPNDGTASPVVAPDGSVLFGVYENDFLGSRGWLLHFSADLQTEYTPGAFGWDQTPGIVSSDMVPSYKGSSKWLILSKYNDYANVGDGTSNNKVAILDPNDTQIDPHPLALGVREMREVITVLGVTRDSENLSPAMAIREWCINSSLINPQTGSVYFDSEDGHLYCWDLKKNSLTQNMPLTAGIGEPYVPTVMGPDGTIYTVNGTYVFAIGAATNLHLKLTSSVPSFQTAISGDPITFSTAVTWSGTSAPSGNIAFFDKVYDGVTFTETALGSVPISSGVVVGKTSTVSLTAHLTANIPTLGNHFIEARYVGDSNYAAQSAYLTQKVHYSSATGSLIADNTKVSTGTPVALTFILTPGAENLTNQTAYGAVTFYDGTDFSKPIDQAYIESNNSVTVSTTSLTPGEHTIVAVFYGDAFFPSQSGQVNVSVAGPTQTALSVTPNPGSLGQNVNLVATVTPLAGSLKPVGTVTFWDQGGLFIGSAQTDTNGVATLITNSLAFGDHLISASFTGNLDWLDSFSISVPLKILNGTKITLTPSKNPSRPGQPVTYSVTLVAQDGSLGVPTGSINFNDGSTTVASVPLDVNGKASYTDLHPTLGTHLISATFPGDATWVGASANVSEVIRNAITALKITSGLNPSILGQAVVFTATVTSDFDVPAGTVNFNDNGIAIGSGTVNSSGMATLSISSLATGNHAISAAFSSTAGFGDSTDSVTQVVQPDTTAPATVTGLKAIAGPDTGAVSLSWNASNDSDSPNITYKVYSLNRRVGAYNLINTTTGLSFVDHPGPGQRRYYYVIAVDPSGNKSHKSAIVYTRGLPAH